VVLAADFDCWRTPTSQAAPTAVVNAHVCGSTAAPPATYKHVVWVFQENHNFEFSPKDPQSGIVGNPAAPFLSDLAHKCTYSTAFHDTQPDMHSEPHYLTALSGSNCDTGYGTTGSGCITDDKSPSHHMLKTPNLLSQLDESHQTWISYQESAPSNCYKSTYNAGFDRSTLTYRCQRLAASSAAIRIVEGVTGGVRADGVVVGQEPSRAGFTV
jgi:hypothetical protein